MASPQFRFVHAGDFHLEAPLCGVADVPTHLRDIFVEAPYQAAEKIFDTTLDEDADFLLLCGDILDPHAAGARGILFLVDHFERLAEKHVPVYWIGGTVDPPDAWPSSARLPDNVHVFARGRPTETVYTRDERPVARICGASRGGKATIHAADYSTIDDGVFSIALAYGKADENALTQRPVDYWALGGRHRRRTLATAPVAVNYPGTPQGRHPGESEAHGCTLVDVDESRHIRTKSIDTDVLRWHSERLVLDAGADERKLEQTLNDRTQRLVDGSAGRHLLISWTVAGGGPAVRAWRNGKLADELLIKLRGGFGQQSAAVWTVAIEAELSGTYSDSWFEEDTMLGEFLRNSQRLQDEPTERIDLQRYIGSEYATSAVAATVEIHDSAVRQEVLQQATLLGVELLRGAETRS